LIWKQEAESLGLLVVSQIKASQHCQPSNLHDRIRWR